MKTTILLQSIIFIFLLPNSLLSQDEIWEVFLNSESVQDLTIDEDTIWCATNGGIVAVSKENYSLTHYNSLNSSLEFVGVNNCVPLNNSSLLFSNKGLQVYDRSSWTVYDNQNSNFPADAFIIHIAKGNNETALLGMSNGEIYRFKNNTLEYVTDLCVAQAFVRNVNAIYEDLDSTIWASGAFGICHYADGISTTYNSDNSSLSNSTVTSIEKDSLDTFWFGTFGGVNSFDGNNWTTYNMLNIGLFSNKVISLHIDHQHRIWVGTEGGLALFHNNQWTTFTTQNSAITGNVITSIASDPDGTVYIGTAFDGLTYSGLNIYKDGNWNAIGLSNSMIGSNTIEDIEQQDSSKILIASGASVSTYDMANWENFPAPLNAFFPNIVYDIELDSENIPWVLLANGLAKFEHESYTFYDHIGNSGNYTYYPRTLAIDAADNKWMGTDQEGIFLFDNVDWTNLNSTNSALVNNNINDIERDLDNNMWVGCGESGGLFKVQGTDWQHYTNQNTDLPQNTSNWVSEIEIDQNNLKYISTHSFGIFDEPFENWTIYTTSNSELPNMTVICSAREANGTLWIGTGVGLAKLEEEEEEEEWTIYTIDNSPLTDNTIADIFIDSHNNKWIGTSFGGLFLLKDDDTIPVLEKEESETSFSIGPNPSSGTFTISNQGYFKDAIIEIYNAIGQAVFIKNYQLFPGLVTIELSDLSAGIYFCTIKTKGKNETHPIVISK